MKNIKVKNMEGTSGLDCKCGSWLDHWDNFNDDELKSSELCANIECENDAENGGHVKKSDNPSKAYIVPLCDECNNSNFKESYCVPEEYLVTATCNRE